MFKNFFKNFKRWFNEEKIIEWNKWDTLEKLSVEDKKHLAKLLIPYLAWEFTRSEISNIPKGGSRWQREAFIEPIVQRLYSIVYNNQIDFTVMIVPDTIRAEENAR